jgi:hypothetical protein
MRSTPAQCISAAVVSLILTACSGPTLPSTSADCSAFTPSSPDIVCITGTVRYFGFEGGFWAVRGDNDTTYDPLDAMPARFRREGLRVRVEARLPPLFSFHMAGPIIEILEIERLIE